MAQRTQVLMFDDLDNTPVNDGEGETIKFSLEGTSYEIDLSNENAAAMREALSRYVQAGRRVGSTSGRAPRTHKSVDADPKAVRAWAASNNVELSPRGRIPASVVEQFKAAGN